MNKDFYYCLGLGYEFLNTDENCPFFVKVKLSDTDTYRNIKFWSFKIDKIETTENYTYFYSYDKEINKLARLYLKNFAMFDKKNYYNFLRGFIQNCGNYIYKNKNIPPILILKVNKELKFLLDIVKSEFSKQDVVCYGNKCSLTLSGYEQYDFLTKIYSNLNRDIDHYSKRMRDYYNYVRNYSQINSVMKYVLNDPVAVAPWKSRGTDSGYDLTLIKKIKKIGDIEFFDTCVSVQPPCGYYFDLVPRSSLSKSGYILANNTGIIDQSYTGNIIVPLIKIEKSLPDITLPFRGVQIIPRRIIHFDTKRVLKLEETDRSFKGFGSSNNF